MRVHTQGFKEQIKELGREIDSRITYGENTIFAEELFSVSPILNADILKSVMKQLDFESSIQVPQYTVIKYEFGLKVNGEYEYLDYGNYIVYSSEYNEDTQTYEHICYDSMLFSMKEYIKLQNGTFPMTVREFITNLCLDCGLVFKNASDTFANYDKTIESDLYANLDYTYRDIFDELSQVTASSICIDNNNMVEIRYINETNDIIDEEYLKDINVKFGQKYGPINSVVLSRSAESDNIYYPEVLPENPCEIKIKDNQIMNFNNRSEFLPDIYEKLKGLEYYINDYTSTGILYYELCDKYTVKIGENTYDCVLFNNEPKITQGIIEDIYTELPEESVTDYTKADKTDRKINRTYLMVDKQNQQIQSVVSSVNQVSTDLNNNYTSNEELEQKLEEQKSSITTEMTTMVTQTKEEVTTEVITKINQNGVETLKNTLVTINQDGINVSKSDEDVVSLLDNKGLYVSDGTLKEDNSNLLMKTDRSGAYFKTINVQGTIKENDLIQKEKITHDKYGTCQAWYWVGD